MILSCDIQEHALKTGFEHPVKVTALFYLREALLTEQYETMSDLIEIAKEFGAGYWDIRIALSKIDD